MTNKFWSFLLLSALLVSGGYAETAGAKARRTRKTHTAHRRVIQPLIIAPEEPSPVVSSKVLAMLAQVADKTPRRLAEDFHANPCELFDETVAIVESRRIVCKNAIYLFESETPPFWFETDRASGKVERETLVEFSDHESILTTYVLSGNGLERGLYLARK